MRRSEAMEIVGTLWRVVNGPSAGTTDRASLEHVRKLTARIEDDPDLTTSLKLRAANVRRRCRVLFDEDALAAELRGDAVIAGALARNAVIELMLSAEKQVLPGDGRRSRPAHRPASDPAGLRGPA